MNTISTGSRTTIWQMRQQTYPILRCATVLQPTISVPAEAAVGIGRALLRNSDLLIGRLRTSLAASVPDWTLHSPASDPASLRARLFPAITIDFPAIAYSWRSCAAEFRICMTACSGQKRAKIWSRYNLRSATKDRQLIRNFFDFHSDASRHVHTIAIGFYQHVSEKVCASISYSPSSEIAIRMVTSDDQGIQSIVEDHFATINSAMAESDKRLTAAKLLHSSASYELNLNLTPETPDPTREGRASNRIIGFRYPRHQPTRRTGDRSDLIETHDDNIEAICLVNVTGESVYISGVAHDPWTPEDFRRSASHIASGEISFEVGNLY